MGKRRPPAVRWRQRPIHRNSRRLTGSFPQNPAYEFWASTCCDQIEGPAPRDIRRGYAFERAGEGALRWGKQRRGSCDRQRILPGESRAGDAGFRRQARRRRRVSALSPIGRERSDGARRLAIGADRQSEREHRGCDISDGLEWRRPRAHRLPDEHGHPTRGQGGGRVAGGVDAHDRLIREIAVVVPAAVVFVTFGRAPEIEFPVALEEAYAATTYVANHGDSLDLDGARLAVVGDGAGGIDTIDDFIMLKASRYSGCASCDRAAGNRARIRVGLMARISGNRTSHGHGSREWVAAQQSAVGRLEPNQDDFDGSRTRPSPVHRSQTPLRAFYRRRSGNASEKLCEIPV